MLVILHLEGQERPLEQWVFVHCPPDTNHIIIGAGDAPCVVVAVGSLEHQDSAGWGGYPVDETALRHGAGVEFETTDVGEAYARVGRRKPARFRDGWLPDRPPG